MPRDLHRRAAPVLSHSSMALIVSVTTFGMSPASSASETPRQAAAVRPLEAGDEKIVEVARQGARLRLRTPECRKLLADFRDGEGRPLEERLAAYALPPDEFLAILPLLDGSSRPLCQANRSHLLTTAGVPRIFVCRSFLKAVYRERQMAEVYLIHELLHALGLGENPPTSHDITRQVVRRCAP